MRPALQRLLARPTSLDFLQCLLAAPTPATANTGRLICSPQNCRRYTGVALREEEFHSNAQPELPLSPQTDSKSVTNKSPPSTTLIPTTTKKKHGPWHSNWSQSDFEFESDIERVDAKRLKLVHDLEYRGDLRLWAVLLDYRQRIYGSRGVYMYWTAVKLGKLQLPTSTWSPLANKFWLTFLNLGFEDDKVLHEVCNYADDMLDSTGKAWPKLYTTVLQHMLLNGREIVDIQHWHNLLKRRHGPSERLFAVLCQKVIATGGNQNGLKYLYKNNPELRGSFYSKIVPRLCIKEDFLQAYDWHKILVKRGDLPATLKDVQPLVLHFAVYDSVKAQAITTSLRKVNPLYMPNLEASVDETTKISREIVSIIHGGKFGIEPKQYNDSLGARWFATRWVSLDVALNAVGALGIQKIGPLSLQAIALREPDSEAVTRRLNQLSDMGVSIGVSIFARAVDKFAREGNEDFLQGLLKSDQHPDALEDRQVQEELMAYFARCNDWPQYRRTLAIRLIGNRHHSMESHNVVLRSLMAIGDTSAMLQKLRTMQMADKVVTPYTVRKVLTYVLRNRRLSKRPQTQDFTVKETLKKDDLTLAIEILRDIMVSGSFVPITFWREIITRLGMLQRMDDMEVLCSFLASWYGPANQSRILGPDHSNRGHNYRVPSCVPTRHALHPLKMLFGLPMQAAIVEWGFINGLEQKLHGRNRAAADLTQGLKIIKQLNQYGVYINTATVRRAVINRLISLYGPGTSNRKRIRMQKWKNPYSLAEVIWKINQIYGAPIFTLEHLQQQLTVVAKRRIVKRDAKRRRLKTTKDPLVFATGLSSVRRAAIESPERQIGHVTHAQSYIE